MASIGNVFEMATRRMLAGSRPTRRAASAMRSRTLSSRARSAAESSTIRGLLLQLRDERLRRGGVRAARRKLQVGFELGGRSSEVAFVHERHSELIVRLRVARVGLDGALELLLGLANFTGIPEYDALVVHRIGARAGTAGRREIRRQLSRLGAGLGRLVELPLRVVDGRQTVIG